MINFYSSSFALLDTFQDFLKGICVISATGEKNNLSHCKNEEMELDVNLPNSLLALTLWLAFFLWSKVIEKEKLCFSGKGHQFVTVNRFSECWLVCEFSKNYRRIRVQLTLFFPYGFHIINRPKNSYWTRPMTSTAWRNTCKQTSRVFSWPS